MPEEAVDVVYNGEMGSGKWWILHIEPTGAVNIWRRSSGSGSYQRIADEELRIAWGTLSVTIGAFVNSIVASLDIEGLSMARSPGPIGGVDTLSEITYKVTPVSG